jgi:hypothetical protein
MNADVVLIGQTCSPIYSPLMILSCVLELARLGQGCILQCIRSCIFIMGKIGILSCLLDIVSTIMIGLLFIAIYFRSTKDVVRTP